MIERGAQPVYRGLTTLRAALPGVAVELDDAGVVLVEVEVDSDGSSGPGAPTIPGIVERTATAYWGWWKHTE